MLTENFVQGNRLAEWLKNAAQMPQYVHSFKENAITVSSISSVASSFSLCLLPALHKVHSIDQ